MHAAWPSLAAYVPRLHGSGASRAEPGHSWPTGQSIARVALVASTKRPGGAGSHAALPSTSAKRPAMQAWHDVAKEEEPWPSSPPGWYRPAPHVLHAVAPDAADAIPPAPHARHVERPMMGAYRPSWHGVTTPPSHLLPAGHASLCVAPLPLTQRPASGTVQSSRTVAIASDARKRPAAHILHCSPSTVAVAKGSFPAAQPQHSVAAADAKSALVHDAHTVALPLEYRPGAQLTHAPAAALERVPAAHATHPVAAPASLRVPPPQASHAVRPVVAAKNPGAHVAHALERAVAA